MPLQKLNDWLNIKVVVKDGHLKIFGDQELLLEHTLPKSLDRIGGVSFVFDGFGEVKQVKLRDLEQELVVF